MMTDNFARLLALKAKRLAEEMAQGGISQEELENYVNKAISNISYNSLSDKPMINGVELVGDISLEELGIDFFKPEWEEF